MDLPEEEILVVSTNDSERQLAVQKYDELLQSTSSEPHTRSKSKSPRRSRRERDAVPPSPAPPEYKKSTVSTGSVNLSLSARSKSAPRRPHTSAGPRDKAFSQAAERLESAYGITRDPRNHHAEEEDDPLRKRRAEARARPDTSNSAKSNGGKGFIQSPRMSFTASGGSSGTSTSTTASNTDASSSSHDSDEMRAWEEELARIEIQSRRSSDMLGFAGKRKRSVGPLRMIPCVGGNEES